MEILIAAVVLVGILGLFNLLLTAGVVRRLREHAELISKSAGRGQGADPGLLAPGESAEPFAAESVAGRQIALTDLVPGSVVAFFSPSCQPCKERAPEFAAYAAGRPPGAEPTVAVVVASEAEAEEMTALLSPVTEVVTGAAAEKVAAAFRTESYPSFYVMGATGTVSAGGHNLSVLPVAAAA
ncbi:TlpA family protein disulfide reductase [Micromonospora citrea]|uniref:TlpA family protein disulfide reductase n=1 Tax=Micromonospora citrea TaxID=47855 RepID=UPI003C4C3A72